MTSGRTTPLAALLIISAVDLLLCCFTMGVMLFLVFQPSQRADLGRSALVLRNDEQPLSTPGVGERETPVVIILNNLGTNKLEAHELPLGFKRVSTKPAGVAMVGGMETTILTAMLGTDVDEISFESNGQVAGPLEAKISVAARGQLMQKAVKCEVGGVVKIRFEESTTIDSRCLSASANLCPQEVRQLGDEFSVQAEDLDPRHMRLLILPEGAGTSFSTPVCVVSPLSKSGVETFERSFATGLLGMAEEQCGVKRGNHPNFAEEEGASCVRSRLLESGKTTWASNCSPRLDGKYARAYFVFRRMKGEGDSCERVELLQ